MVNLIDFELLVLLDLLRLLPAFSKVKKQQVKWECTLHSQNLQVIDIDKERNWVSVMGSVPGPNGGYIIVRKSKHCK